MEGKINRINNVSLVILATFAITCGLIYTKGILIPFVISLFLYAISSPAITWFQEKAKLPKMLSALLTILIFIGVMSLVVIFVVYSVKRFMAGADAYTDRIAAFVTQATDLLATWDINVDGSRVREELRNLPFLKYLKSLTGSVVSLVGNTTLILIITSFLIAGEGATKSSHPLYEHINKKVSRYVLTKFSTSFVTSVLVGILLVSFRVDLAFMFAILVFCFNFIPNIGSIIATILPLPIVMLQFGLGGKFMAIALGSLLIQFTIGNVIEPKIMGESMDLHPVAVLLFLMFWGLVWGLPGMFMAVPITAVLKIILSRIETTKPIAELLAGRIPHFD